MMAARRIWIKKWPKKFMEQFNPTSGFYTPPRNAGRTPPRRALAPRGGKLLTSP